MAPEKLRRIRAINEAFRMQFGEDFDPDGQDFHEEEAHNERLGHRTILI